MCGAWRSTSTSCTTITTSASTPRPPFRQRVGGEAVVMDLRHFSHLLYERVCASHALKSPCT